MIQSLVNNWLNNKHYQTLKDLENNPNDKIKQLKEIFPDIFQDGVLNFELLKQHLGQSENIAESNVFGLYWNGKNKASINSRMPLNSKTLKPLRDQSLNFDEAQNIIIEGDNLEALKILQKAYFNQVDVIYIDPPYNTGNDFVYDDDYSQSTQDYKEENNLVDEKGLKTTTNQKTTGRFHTNWLNMIYSRLILARSLLKDDGVIFISIDDNEQAKLKLICDEIFGEDNFITNFIWERTYHSNKNSDGKKVFKNCDYILSFSKNKNKLKYFNEGLKTNFEDAPLKNNSNTKREYIFPINSIFFKKTNSWNEKDIKINFKSRWNQEKINSEILFGTKFIIKNDNYENIRALYSPEKSGYSLCSQLLNTSSLYVQKYFNSTTEKGTKELEKLNINSFDYPKPKELLKYLLNLNLNRNALILDFFAGSGTTGQAVMELNQEDDGNRKYILVQLPEKVEDDSEFKTICDITKARIERSIVKYQYNDKGFKYFKVVPTNFQLWQATTQDDSQIIEKQLDLFSQSINEQNDYEAILYELMLKSGMRLDWEIKSRIISDHQFWIDEQIDNLFFLKPQNLEQVLETIKQVLKEKTNDSNTKVYINEAYFQGQAGDQNKLNLWEQIKQFNKQQNKQITLVVF